MRKWHNKNKVWKLYKLTTTNESWGPPTTEGSIWGKRLPVYAKINHQNVTHGMIEHTNRHKDGQDRIETNVRSSQAVIIIDRISIGLDEIRRNMYT